MGTPQKGPTVQRLARRINNPADPAVIRCDLGLAQKLDPVTDRHPVARGIRQDRTAPRSQPQNLAPGHAVGQQLLGQGLIDARARWCTGPFTNAAIAGLRSVDSITRSTADIGRHVGGVEPG